MEKRGKSESSMFFLGIILLGVGLFILSKRVIVSSSWYRWSVFGYDLSSGLVIIPLLAGLIWLFYNPKSIIAKILSCLGAIFIFITIIMSIRIHFMATSLFDYLLIIVLIAAGTGLLLRTMLKKKD